MQPIDEGDANRLMSLIDAALASGSPVTEIAMDHDGTPCRLVLASGVGISWVRGLLGEPATEPKPEPQLLGNPLELPEEARGPSEVEQLRKERDEARAAGDAKLRQFADWIRSHGDCTEEEALTEIDRLLANPPANHTSDDDPLREWLETYDPDDNMSTSVKQDAAALAELCRRALGER